MRIGFVNGCFDLFHAGHRLFLKFATEQCDYLVVAINSDESVRRLKGADRPVHKLPQRMSMVNDFLWNYNSRAVFPFEGLTDPLIMNIRPDVIIVGGDHDHGMSALALRGIGWKEGAPPKIIPIVVAPYLPGVSTTQIIQERSDVSSDKG